MPPLHAPAACTALPEVNPKLPHDDPRDGQLFLVLRRDPRRPEPAAAVRAGGRQRRLVALIDPTRPSTVRLHPIPRARLAARSAWAQGQGFREGRRLTMRGTPGLVQLTLHPLEFTTQPLVLVLQPLALAALVIALPLGALGAFAQIAARVGSLRIVVTRPLLRHATFMADSRKKYKYGILDSVMRDRVRVSTR
jgi:hypothetical protein